MLQAVEVDLQFGESYRFRPEEAGKKGSPWQAGLAYRPLGLALHVHSHQRVVCYVGVEGADEGNWYVCTLLDWSQKFRRVVPAASVPEKTAGHISDSIHG